VTDRKGDSDGSHANGDRIGAADGAPAKFRRASRSADRDGFDEAGGAQARSSRAPRQARLEQQRPSGIRAAQIGNRETTQRSLIGENVVG
jgi:hypothetical protein